MKYLQLILLLLPFIAFSQNTFQKTYCQSLTNDPIAWSITQTYDNGYVAVGWVDNGSTIDGIIVKTDSTGQLLWSKKFPSIQTLFYSVIETSDSGLIVTGLDYISLMLLKTDPLGNILWQKKYNNHSDGYSVKELSDEGLIVIGVPNQTPTADIFALRTDKLGNIVWAKTIDGNSSDDYGGDVQQCPDGGIILAGSTSSFGSGLEEAFLIKLDSAGTIQWGRTYANSYSNFSSNFRSLTVDIDGGFVILGNHYNTITSASYMGIIKTDSLGNLLWNKFYDAGGTHLSKTRDGGFIITGGSTGSAFLMKADANGEVLWSRDLPGGTSLCVESTYDSGFITAGDDFQLTKTDQYGNSGCNLPVFFNPVNDTILVTNWNISSIDGATSNIGALSSVTLSGENTICSSLSSRAFQESPGITISPNPASDKLTVECKLYTIHSIELYDILGSKLELFRQSNDSPKHEVTLEVSKLTPGMYVVKTQTEFGTGIKKIIVE